MRSTEFERFHTEIERLRLWATAQPVEMRIGEWEVSYPRWPELRAAWDDSLASAPPSRWDAATVAAALYAIARDNEDEYLVAGVVRVWGGEEVEFLARASLVESEVDARFQLANAIARAPAAHAADILLELVSDEDEYVRRRALGAMASLAHPATEQAAVALWNEPGPHPCYMRMAVLSALLTTQSALLEDYLTLAERDSDPRLVGYARRMGRGELKTWE